MEAVGGEVCGVRREGIALFGLYIWVLGGGNREGTTGRIIQHPQWESNAIQPAGAGFYGGFGAPMALDRGVPVGNCMLQ